MFSRLTLLLLVFSFKLSFAQTIDSITVKVSWDKHYSGLWTLNSLRVDSFSGGILMSELNQTRGGNVWQNNYLTTFIYSSGVLVTKTIQQWQNSQWENSERWNYSYNGNPDSVIKETWNNGWINSELTYTFHNYFGADSVTVLQLWQNSSWTNSAMTETTYSVDSMILMATDSRWNDVLMQWYFVGRTGYQMPGADEIHQNYSNGNWVNDMKYNGPYFIDGEKYFESSAGWSNLDSAFTVTHSTGFANYDSLGHLIYTYHDFTPGGDAEQIFTYDPLGNMLTYFSHYESMGGIITENYSEWLYESYPSQSIHIMMMDSLIQYCGGDTIQTNVFAFGGLTPLHIQWTPAAGLSSDTIDSPLMFAAATTNYIITAYDDSSNVAADSLYVIVNPMPTIVSEQIIPPTCTGCSDAEIHYDLNGSGPPFNIWCNAPLGTFTVTDSSIIGVAAGVYIVIITDSIGCQIMFTDTVLGPASGIRSNTDSEFNISPNPFSDHFIIYSNKMDQDLHLDIFDHSGKFVHSENIVSSVQKVDMKELLPGSYIAILRSDNKVIHTFKITAVD